MSLYVIHMRFTRRKILLAAAALGLVTCMALLLAGCVRSAAPCEAVTLATNEQRVAYLESLGWQVLPEPVATMDLPLPEDLKAQWGDYLKLPTQQGMPMAACAGLVVRRFAYTGAGGPGGPGGGRGGRGACGDRLVGGDIIATGENGFLTGLTFPEM